MRGRQVWYVLALILLLGIGGIGARLTSTDREVPVLAGLRALTPENVDKVIMRDWENEVTLLRREDGSWWNDNFPVVQTKLGEFWESAALIEGAELLASNPDSHLEMGVTTEFATLVQFWKGDVLLEEFLVGDKQFVGKSAETAFFLWDVYVRLCFLRPPGRDEVYALYCRFPDRFDPRPRFWKDPIIMEVASEEIETIAFQYPSDQFDLRVIDSVWTVGGGAERVSAKVDLIQNMIRVLELFVARDFPTEAESAALDFDRPDIRVEVLTRPGSPALPATLLFLDAGDGDYWVKRADRPYIYFLLNRDIAPLLLPREQFESGR